MMAWKSGYGQGGKGVISQRLRFAIALSFILMEMLTLKGAQALPWFRSQQSESDRPPDTAGQSAGSRGCTFADNNSLGQSFPPLTILTPEKGLSTTALDYPTFAWLTSISTEHPIEIRIYEYAESQEEIELLYATELSNISHSPGIKLFSLPSFLEPLSIGQHYILQVEVVCNPSHPSGNFFVESEFSRLEISSNLRQELQESVGIADKIQVLNREGFWLDALDLSVQSSQDMAVDVSHQLADIDEARVNTNTVQNNALAQLAIATNDAELHELSQQFPTHVYPTTP